MTYQEIIKKPGRRIKKIVSYQTSNKSAVVNPNNIKSVKLSFNASLLGTVISGTELVLKEEIPKNSTIYVQVIASYGNESAMMTYGPFYPKENAKYDASDKTYNHECYDEMLLTMVDYEPVEIQYPCTIAEFFAELCSKLGIRNLTSNLINGNRQMTSDIYENIGYTYRDVLDDIAIANGTNFRISGGAIRNVDLNVNNQALIDDDILKNTNIDFGEHFGPITSIILSRSDGGDKIRIDLPDVPQEQLFEFEIKDNLLMNENDRDEYLPALLEKLAGIEYDVFDTQLVGYGGFEPLEKVIFETGGNAYNSYVFNWEVMLESGYEESIYSPMVEEQVEEYKAVSETDNSINQAYIIARKNKAEIEQKISGVVGEDGKITSASIILALNNDESLAQINADKISLNGKVINLATDSIIITSPNFSVDVTGKITSTAGKIAGFEINQDDGFVYNIYPPYDYTQQDLNIMIQIITHQITPTQEHFERYDLNKDGNIDALDLLIVRWYIDLGITTSHPGKYIVQPPKDNILANAVVGFKDGNGQLKNGFTYNRATFQNLTVTGDATFANFDSGVCSLTSAGDTTIYFNKTFSSPPNVVLTAKTTTNGVIAGKISEITETYFRANIGGTGFGYNDFCWIATI